MSDLLDLFDLVIISNKNGNISLMQSSCLVGWYAFARKVPIRVLESIAYHVDYSQISRLFVVILKHQTDIERVVQFKQWNENENDRK